MANDTMMAGEPGQSAPSDNGMDEGSEDKDGVSVFIPKAALMGRTYKVGDDIPMTCKDVDPETGDVEAACKPASDNTETSSMSDAFDKAMPEDKGGSYGG